MVRPGLPIITSASHTRTSSGVHTRHDIDWINLFFDSENIPTADLESIFPSLQGQPGGFQPSDLNPQPYLPSPAQVHETFPSDALASTSSDPPKCGRFHQVELIVINPDLVLNSSLPCRALLQPMEIRSSTVAKTRSCLKSKSVPAL